jgi:hypothetical protein
MTLERPYIVCDRCGHQWKAEHEEPRKCENCASEALWAFPAYDAADLHSERVVERNDAADTLAMES